MTLSPSIVIVSVLGLCALIALAIMAIIVASRKPVKRDAITATDWEAVGQDFKAVGDDIRRAIKQEEAAAKERCRRKVESAFSLRDDPTRKDNHRL